MKRRYLTLIVVFTAGISPHFSAPAQEHAPAEGAGDAGAAERQPSLDDLLNLPTRRESAPAEGDEAIEPMTGEPDSTVSPDQVESAPSADAFQLAVADMRQAAERLDGRRDSGLETQRVQERAIRRLDQLVDQLRRQRRQSSSSSQSQQQDTGSQQNASQQQQQGQGQQPSGPTNQSADRAGPQGQVEDGQRNDVPLAEQLSEWGNLPPRLRDQLLQGGDDRFSPLYEQLTEQYYKRLAEQSP